MLAHSCQRLAKDFQRVAQASKKLAQAQPGRNMYIDLRVHGWNFATVFYRASFPIGHAASKAFTQFPYTQRE